MSFVTPEVTFEKISSVDLISSSTDKIVNTGYTDPDGSEWSPRY